MLGHHRRGGTCRPGPGAPRYGPHQYRCAPFPGCCHCGHCRWAAARPARGPGAHSVPWPAPPPAPASPDRFSSPPGASAGHPCPSPPRSPPQPAPSRSGSCGCSGPGGTSLIFVVTRDLLQPTAPSRGGHAVPHTRFLQSPTRAAPERERPPSGPSCPRSPARGRRSLSWSLISRNGRCSIDEGSAYVCPVQPYAPAAPAGSPPRTGAHRPHSTRPLPWHALRGVDKAPGSPPGKPASPTRADMKNR
jgi:hypothetical protein